MSIIYLKTFKVERKANRRSRENFNPPSSLLLLASLIRYFKRCERCKRVLLIL